jgi:hypothetical protein
MPDKTDYCYRQHRIESIPKLVTHGLFSYLPSQTELGRSYPKVYYDGNHWHDQPLTTPLEHRFYYTDYRRPRTKYRIHLRFPRHLLDSHTPIVVPQSKGEYYIVTGDQPLIIVMPHQIEIYYQGEWQLLDLHHYTPPEEDT